MVTRGGGSPTPLGEGSLTLLMGPRGGELGPAPLHWVVFEPNDEPFALDAGLRFLMTPADLELGPGDVVTFTALFEAEALEGPPPGPGPPPPPGPVKSTFDDGDEGWRVFGDAQGASAEPDHNPTGGNPGGYISAADDVTGGTWYWEAPAGFLGDQSEMGMLSFDLKQSATDRPFDNDDVVLEGGGTTLMFDTPNNPGTDWTHYDVPLEAGAGWLNEATGNPATQGEMVGGAVIADGPAHPGGVPHRGRHRGPGQPRPEAPARAPAIAPCRGDRG